MTKKFAFYPVLEKVVGKHSAFCFVEKHKIQAIFQSYKIKAIWKKPKEIL